jgi:heme A synthase
MKQAYRGLAFAIPIGVVLQAAFIAFGTFGVLHSVDDGKVYDENSGETAGQVLHSIGGLVIPILALILFAISFAAKIPEGTKWAGFVLLAAILQIVLGVLAFSVPAIGLLHGINAFVLAGLAAVAARRATGATAGRTRATA